MELMLLGGGNGNEVSGLDGRTTHDWHNLLEQIGWLQHDHTLD